MVISERGRTTGASMESGVSQRSSMNPLSWPRREEALFSFCSDSENLSAAGVFGSERLPLTPFIQPKIPRELRRLCSALCDVVGRAAIVAEPELAGRDDSRASMKDWWIAFGPP